MSVTPMFSPGELVTLKDDPARLVWKVVRQDGERVTVDGAMVRVTFKARELALA